MPEALTSAISGFSLAHDTRCEGIISPLPLRTSAVSESVAPTDTVAVDGATITDSIAGCGPNVSVEHANATGTRIVTVRRSAPASGEMSERNVNQSPLGLFLTRKRGLLPYHRNAPDGMNPKGHVGMYRKSRRDRLTSA